MSNEAKNNQTTTKPNGAVVNGAVKPNVEALTKLAIAKGLTAANVTKFMLDGHDATTIEGLLSAMPDATASEKSIQEQIAELRAENERLKAAAGNNGNISFKMSEAKKDEETGQETKGGSLCVYGLGRFPLNFSQTAIIKIFGNPFVEGDNGKAAELKAFAKANWSKFRTKDKK